MRERVRPRAVVAVVGTVALLVMLLGWLPALTEQHERILSTPGAPPIGVNRTVALASGAPVCGAPVVPPPALRVVRTQLPQTNPQSRPPIGVTLRDTRGRVLSSASL